MSHPARSLPILLLALGSAACPTSPSSTVAGGCSSPAPLLGEKTQAPGYIVVYHDGTEAAEVTRQLATKYDFTPRHVYEHSLRGFSSELSDAALAGIRCEPPVKHVEHDVDIIIR